jgi:hypothetical protein
MPSPDVSFGWQASPSIGGALLVCMTDSHSGAALADSELIGFSLLNFLHAAAGKDAVIETKALDIPRRISVLVAILDQQPVIFSAGVHRSPFDFDQGEPAAQFLTPQYNMDLAVNQLLLRQLIFQWLILSEIPDHHRTGSVLAGRNHALELCIFERMVLGPYGEALSAGFMKGPLGTAQDTRPPFTASRKS